MELRTFSNYCESFLKNPDLGSKIFFQDKNTKYSYLELIESALCRAGYFSHSPDDFFALQLESPYKLFTHLIGAILAQKNVLILSHKEPVAGVARLQENIPFTRILSDMDPEISYGNNSFPEIVNSARPAFFILSSGSSGPPKAIPLSLENVSASAGSVIDYFQMNDTDTSFSNLPHHHIGGLMIFWRAFFSMGKVTTDESQDFSFISLVPLQLQRVLDHKLIIPGIKSCRAVLIGGAPLEKHLKEKAFKNNLKIYETYGMSETCSLVMLNGLPLKGQEVKLDDEGYFMIKGDTLSSSVPVDNDGFYHTRDIGKKNPDGTFSFLHRGDLLFKSAGEMINPLELELKTRELSWITEALVVPINHHEWTRASVLVYRSTDESKSSADLKKHLKNHFHPHQVPRFFLEAPDNLIQEGIKPRRFEVARFAQSEYFKNLFHHLYIPNPSSKNLMVYFHGFMEEHTDLIGLMDNHKETSYLFIDLPGHGKTKASNFKSRLSVFLELKAMIDFYNTENALTLYGYSMGGRIALELTLMGLKPEKLILESAHFGLLSVAEKKSRLESDRKLLSETSDLNEFFKKWYQNPIFSGYNLSAHYKIDLEKKLSHDPLEWQQSLEFFSPGTFPFERSEVISKLKTQKIIGIIGLEDLSYKNHFEEMRESLDNLSVYEIEKCGHNPHKTHLSEIKKILNLTDER